MANYPQPGSVGGYYDPQNPHGYSIPGGGLLGGGAQVGGGRHYGNVEFDPVSGRIVEVYDKTTAGLAVANKYTVQPPSPSDLLLLLLDA